MIKRDFTTDKLEEVVLDEETKKRLAKQDSEIDYDKLAEQLEKEMEELEAKENGKA